MSSSNNRNEGVSIYIHWPFCISKCPYCDFNSHVSANIDHNLWLNCYLKELDYFQEFYKNKYIKSIFFGGGTPSLMLAHTIAGIINHISKLAKIDHNTEITLEANPTSFEAAKFYDFKLAGVNRLSIGVQSLIDKDLVKLGRTHNSATAESVLEQAASIFSNLSFDLIYARNGQTLDQWQNELKTAMQYATGHLSLYQLTIEKGTPFYKLHKDGKLILPSDEIAANMYKWTHNYLKQQKYHRYEISNFAIKGKESRHNLTYWRYDSYLGIGPGAHSRLHYDREKNVEAMMMIHSPTKWIESVREFNHGVQHKIALSAQEIISEIMMMGLRLKEGIDNNKLKRLLNLDFGDVIDHKIAILYQLQGLLRISRNNISLTTKGMIFHNQIIGKLLLT